MSDITVFGADWCGDTQATLAHLQDLGVDFDYVDVDQDESAGQWVKDRNNGKQKLPTVVVGKLLLSIPDDEALDQALRDQGLSA